MTTTIPAAAATTLNQAQAAEARLAQQIDSVAAALDAIGRDHVTEALARLEAAADACRSRLLAGQAAALEVLGLAADGFADLFAEPAPEAEIVGPGPQLTADPGAEPVQNFAQVRADAEPAETVMTPAPAPITAEEPAVTVAANATAAEPAPPPVLTPAPEVDTPPEDGINRDIVTVDSPPQANPAEQPAPRKRTRSSKRGG